MSGGGTPRSGEDNGWQNGCRANKTQSSQTESAENEGIKGDNINVMLAAADMNFKRMLNKWKVNQLVFFGSIFPVPFQVDNTRSKFTFLQNESLRDNYLESL